MELVVFVVFVALIGGLAALAGADSRASAEGGDWTPATEGR